MLILKKISKFFGNKKVIDTVELTIKKGDIILFLGTSGVGKSTLLRVLCGLEIPEEGTIELEGKILTQEVLQKTHLVGMVFQHFNLFSHMSVIINITFPLEKALHIQPDHAKKIALQLLEKYHLQDKAHNSIHDLSGGQKQRLALARTMALKPQIVCLDEPTSALDPSLTAQVAQSIQDLSNEGYTVIIASHDITLLEKLPCIIHLMSKGKILESAPSQNFWNNKSAYPNISSFVQGKI